MTAQYDFRRISIALIDIPEDRLRGIKPHRVETLSKDIAAQGQLQPIIVAEAEKGRFVLVKGLQRLQAVKAGKGKEIDARVTLAADNTAIHRRLQEVLATLNREDYTALERCEALSELKQIHETLYPESRNGGDRKSQAAKNKLENQNPIFGFRSEAAAATGLSLSAISLAVAIWSGLAATTRVRIRGTWIEDKQSELRSLSVASQNVQATVLDLLLATPPKAVSVADAIELAEGRTLTDAGEKAYRTVLEKWKRFPIGQKRTFVTANRDEILRILREEGAL